MQKSGKAVQLEQQMPLRKDGKQAHRSRAAGVRASKAGTESTYREVQIDMFQLELAYAKFDAWCEGVCW